MKIAVKAVYLLICAGLVVLVSILVPSLFTSEYYVGMFIAAVVAFVWFYGNRYISEYFDKSEHGGLKK